MFTADDVYLYNIASYCSGPCIPPGGLIFVQCKGRAAAKGEEQGSCLASRPQALFQCYHFIARYFLLSTYLW
jgi:hypothetical protein